MISASPMTWAQGEATCSPTPPPRPEDDSPPTSPPLSPHHQILEKLFRPTSGSGKALQIILWTCRSSSDQLLLSSTATCLQTAAVQGRSCLLPQAAPGCGSWGASHFPKRCEMLPGCASLHCSLSITQDPFAQQENADQRPDGDQSSYFLRQVRYVANYIYILLLLQKKG